MIEALLTYTTTLAFYLHLRSSAKYTQNPELLKTHPIMSRLLALKQSISTLEDLDFAPSDDDSDMDDDDDGDEEKLDREQLWQFNKLTGLEDDELSALIMDAESDMPVSSKRQSAQKPPKKKRKLDAASSTKKPVLPVFDLVEPVYTRSKPSSSSSATDFGNPDAYGEATSLQHADQADKAARKKSLRFHTSKIESASARRQGARSAVGGDDDIPYRERKKEKDVRLAKESEKKVKGQGGDDLDDAEPEADTRKRSRDDDDDHSGAEGADGYYELVKRKTKEMKDKKKTDYEEAQAAARYVLHPVMPPIYF